jgi:hypothetical protein
VVLDDPVDVAAAATTVAEALETDVAEADVAVEVHSEITFPVPVDDVAAVVEEGSSERIELESGFKTAMAAALGGGSAVVEEHIVIDSITAGSVEVAFHIVVPPAAAQAAASLFATLAAATDAIEIEIGGETIAANAMAPAVAMEVANVDCGGLFATCTTDCTKTYKVYKEQSGTPWLYS